MDLIYMDKNRIERGVLLNYNLDMDIGIDNDFEINVSIYNHVLKYNHMFYIEDTEYGGIVDTVKSDTRNFKIYYGGRTWRGILNSKIIRPLPGEDYYMVSGDANRIIDEMIGYLGLGELFEADSRLSGINISSYSFNRYVSLLNGLNSMLSTKNARLKIRYVDKKIIVSAEEVEDKSDEIEISGDSKVSFVAEVRKN